MCEYLIIADPDNYKADIEILKFLRRFHLTFSTGYYYNGEATGNMRACAWYYFIDNENMREVFDDSAFRYGKNKIMTTDGCFFACNCNDTDLPLIEDVWESIKPKE